MTQPPLKKKGGSRAAKKPALTNVQALRRAMSPHSPMLIPSLTSAGAAFPYGGMVRVNISLAVGDRAIIAVTNTGTAGTIMARVQLTAAGVFVRDAFTIPTLALGDEAGGPTSGRAMKCGVSVVNTTQFLNRGGRVYHLNADQRVRLAAAPSAWSVAQFGSAFETLIAHPRTIEGDGAEYGKPREFISHVVDQSRYNDFAEWNGTATLDEFYLHTAVWPASAPSDRPMSTTFLCFDAPATTNTYTLTARGVFYTRWPLDTVPGQCHQKVPVAEPHAVNTILGGGEALADTAHTIEGIGLGAMAARAWPVLRQGIGRMAARAAPYIVEGAELALMA